MSKYDLRSACAVISGASSGLGYEISKLLCSKYGCRVIGLARRKEKLDAVRVELGENFIPFACDVTSESDRARLLEFIKDYGFKPDILINNAGILPKFSHFSPKKTDELERVMALNFFAHTEMCATFMPLLLESERGAIVNVASSAALAALPGTSAYSASKSALLAFTQSLSLEYGKNLYVACICPGMTATELFASHDGSDIIERFASSPEGAARKIVRRISRRKIKIVTGFDAHIMSGGNRIFGTAALKVFAFFIKIVKLPVFRETFYKKEDK